MSEPPTSRDDLADLLRRAGKGDSAALTDLLRRYESRVRLAARALLRSPLRQALDSVDLVQSVHRALLPGLQDGRYSFTDEGQLLALAVTVLRHKFQRAAQKKRPAALSPEAEPIDRSVSAPAANPDAADLLAHLLDEVDEHDRRALELLAQGYSTAEIATTLGCTPAVLRARLSRARSRLRKTGLSDQT